MYMKLVKDERLKYVALELVSVTKKLYWRFCSLILQQNLSRKNRLLLDLTTAVHANIVYDFKYMLMLI